MEESLQRDRNHSHCLSVNNLTSRINKREIVRDVSLSVYPGEIVGLLGPNGAGKSTLFNTISGLKFPIRGNVLIDGIDVSNLPLYLRAQHGLGLLPQESSIFQGLTVEQNIMAALEVKYKDKSLCRQYLENLLTTFAIEEIRTSKGSNLSGGQRRRVEFARCFACNPRYILLDEPFAGLDPIIIKEITKNIRTLVEFGVGIMIIDHNILATLAVVDHVYILLDGEIITHGTSDQVSSNQVVREHYLGTDFKLDYQIQYQGYRGT
ncbi:MAG: LPS export ABC transporter ATP-binding protein [Paracoccaceae bacterium]|nr:LPS export ABC transporter ATP-binding protein [Paracoccaceae bacterium]MDE2674551.1 LPS export ABC transporter ATP-binding protein [Paracoccaceae bacterium]MYF45019.1 LPS export ABC transporter ATP-binding protein [Paracoccaceae bacterium]MYI91242.1 LPS export ABC transporter ATP-binding protein [Paracoccaceae bacterium]